MAGDSKVNQMVKTIQEMEKIVRKQARDAGVSPKKYFDTHQAQIRTELIRHGGRRDTVTRMLRLLGDQLK